ncbi:MAG: amidohydrolase family protein, partial [Verrucomicrobia bacterium]|nr:amidohydrolase family protein [Verrucomicrobiota bacterium]
MTIDAHQHFWRYNAADFDWIGEPMQAIRRDFLPGDLQREIAAAGVDGVVSVQARQTLEETRWLLELAGQHDFIKGVVGWVELASSRVRADLERFAADQKFKGARHVVQDEPDEHFILRDDFNRGVAALGDLGLRY